MYGVLEENSDEASVSTTHSLQQEEEETEERAGRVNWSLSMKREMVKRAYAMFAHKYESTSVRFTSRTDAITVRWRLSSTG